MSEAPPLVEARDVVKTFRLGPNAIEVLKGVSLRVGPGETVSITGASGAGKSTLLHALGGLEQPSSGTVLLHGEDVYRMPGARRNQARARTVGFVFQAYHLLPELDVADNVLLPAMTQRGALRRAGALRARALELLDRVGLAHRAAHRPMELSGGEQQRAALARALMNEPELVLADEPTGNLDSRTGGQVLEYLFALTEGRRHTLVLVTHNDAVAALCARRMRLRDGRLEG